MQIHYLEIVTEKVDAVCSAYAAANGVQFGKPDAGLGNARTATLLGDGLVGVRAPMHETEEPVIRPYWLVDDIEAAVTAAVEAGGEVAHPLLEVPGHGTFAIYTLGGRSPRPLAAIGTYRLVELNTWPQPVIERVAIADLNVAYWPLAAGKNSNISPN